MFRSNEQRHFGELVAKHIGAKDAPLLLEGGTGLGKTRAYLAALADCEETVAIVLPTHQLIDQLIASPDLKAVGLDVEPFRSARMFDNRADYPAHRAVAMASRVMVCTAASVMIDQRLSGNYNGVTNRGYLLFDEADQLPQAAALQQDLTISEADLKEAAVSLPTLEETLTALLNKARVEPEVRARAKIMVEVVGEPAWYHTVGRTDEGGIALYHRLPGRLLKRIANRGNVSFISATLTIVNRFDDFMRSMGIDHVSRFSGKVEPAEHGQITVETPLGEDVIQVISDAERPCLVATTSHDEAGKLGLLLSGAIVRSRDETTSQAASRVSEDGILIAAGAWAGLDTPIRWSSIVVPKIPFEQPTVLDDEIESRYIDSRNVAVRRMRQVVGRGIRSPDASCTIYILDERYKKLGQFLPDRFKESWAEGGRGELTYSKAERDPAIRNAALKHYGCKCFGCDLVPPHRSIIDIHHLDPISEGERLTTLDDVIPLCANCHRRAHTEEPPIPIEKLRELAIGERGG